jgi:GntR family transcriptional regulator/MocR family aminotransferase
MDGSKADGIDRSKRTSDFLSLRIEEAPAGAMSRWLAERIRAALGEHRLRPGDRLPATRTLATELGVSRGVVTDAYRRLIDDGTVVTGGRGGTIIAPGGPEAPGTTVAPGTSVAPGRTAVPGTTGPRRFRADRPGRTLFARPTGDAFTALRAAPARFDLSPGVPDLAAFPRTGWLRTERAVFDELTPDAFGYGDPAGTPRLRQAVAGWLARFRGITADPDEIVIVAGVAQALALLARVLTRRGPDRIAVEDPGSLGARQQLQHWGMTTVGVAVDDAGLRVDALRATGAPVVLVSPAHSFPMGVVLDGTRRRELATWASDGGLIVEDDYDAEHRYDRPPVVALRATQPDRVCYTGSVSKILAPALRIGWLLPPAWLYDELVTAKQEADLGNPVLPQLVLAGMMRDGRLEGHLRAVRRRHRRRRDAMVAALAQHLPAATVHGAAAGLHLSVTFDDPSDELRDDRALAAAALAAGVKVQPLSWHRIQPGPPGLVLGYAARSAGEIDQGIAVLGAIVRAR